MHCPNCGAPYPNQAVAVWPPISAWATPPINAWTPQSDANCAPVFIHQTKLVQMRANIGAVLPWSWSAS